MPNSIRLGTLTRSMPFKAESQRTAEDGSPVVRIAISSEFPVLRDFGNEILDHSTASCDLSRMTHGAPFCVDHDLKEQVGVLENVSLDSDRVLRADVRFSRSQRGQDILNDIVDGIRKHISVGYAVRKMKLERKSDGPDTYRVTDWMPFEASTVAVPADPTVGVGRSAPDNATDVEIVCEEADTTEERATVITTDVVTVSESTETVTLDDNGALVSDEYTTTSTTTVATTYETTPPGGDTQPEERATDTETDGGQTTRNVPLMTVAEPTISISPAVLESTRMEHINVADPIVLTEKERKEYSLIRALNNLANGQRSGFEFEVSQEIAKRSGKDTLGFYMPTSVSTTTRALASNGEGADIIFAQGGDIIESLKAKAIVGQLGAQFLSGLTAPLTLPRQTSTLSASWVAEGSAGSNSDLTFDQVALAPKGLIAATVVNKQVLATSNYDVEGFIRRDIETQFVNALDTAVLQGSGSTQPAGLYYNANANSVSGVSGSVITYAMIVGAEGAVADQNALGGALAYVVTPTLATKLKTTSMNASGTTAEFIWTPQGTVNGYKAVQSTLLPGSGTTNQTAIFGDWSQVIVADFGAIEFVVDPYSAKRSMQLEIAANWLVDVAIRQPKAFTVLKFVKTA